MVERTGFVEGSPGNYYGCVSVWKEADDCYMGVENWDGLRGTPISQELYDAFVKEFQS